MDKPEIAQHSFEPDTCTLNNGVIVYDLDVWRSASPSYTDLLFDWTAANSASKLYSLGSQPPFNLVVCHSIYSMSIALRSTRFHDLFRCSTLRSFIRIIESSTTSGI